MRYRIETCLLTILLLLAANLSAASDSSPIEGERFDSLIARQQVDLQQHLAALFDESEGYLVTGPLGPFISGDRLTRLRYRSLRVVCPGPKGLNRAELRFARDGALRPRKVSENRFAGSLFSFEWNGRIETVLFITFQQLRVQIWLRSLIASNEPAIHNGKFVEYLNAVYEHADAIDHRRSDSAVPSPGDYGLPDTIGFLAPSPDYVIDGYQNYKDFLFSHRTISADFAMGITAFVPGDSLLHALKNNAPSIAFPNKEAAMFQHEWRKFFSRDGDMKVIQTLTGVGFDTLQAGEYFFAVSAAGKIRFGRELPRKEVKRLEKKTGEKVPRANHSFLFPGEPVLTAGAFFISRDNKPHIVEVNAQSGHYFYSNITSTIREDISSRSDSYLLTLGHFFVALDRLGIEYANVLIWKI